MRAHICGCGHHEDVHYQGGIGGNFWLDRGYCEVEGCECQKYEHAQKGEEGK